MAKCQCCSREMPTADGCGVGEIHIGGKIYPRIKCGTTEDLFGEMEEGARCHDCGALAGFFHHWNCDAERCPACGEQLLSCDCEDVYVDDNSEGEK